MVLIFTLLSLLFGICCFVVQPPMILLNNKDNNEVEVLQRHDIKGNDGTTLYLPIQNMLSEGFLINLIDKFSQSNPYLSIDSEYSTSTFSYQTSYYCPNMATYWSICYYDFNLSSFVTYHPLDVRYQYDRIQLSKSWTNQFQFNYKLDLIPYMFPDYAISFNISGVIADGVGYEGYNLIVDYNYPFNRFIVCHINNIGQADYLYQAYQKYIDNETIAYQNGFIDGRDQAGYEQYERGYTIGWTDGNNTGLSNGYQSGYTAGYDEGASQDDTAAAIFVGITEVGLLPVNVFLGMFNYEVFGINISGLISALITVTIVIIIFRFLLGKKND